MEVQIAKCNNPSCRDTAVIPNENGRCRRCNGILEFLSNHEDIVREGIPIPPYFLISMGGNGNGTPKFVPGSPVPPGIKT